MKFTFRSVIVICLAAIVTTQGVQAAEPASKRELAGVSSGAIIGGSVGGPVGMILGAAIGAHYGYTQEQATNLSTDNKALSVAHTDARNKIRQSQEQLSRVEQQLATTTEQVQSLNREIDQLFAERALISGLQFDVHFGTDKTQLSDNDRHRLLMLADLLKRIPEARVQLRGYADERGAPEYNDTLSLDRAFAVADALSSYGVASQQLRTYAFGESKTLAESGELEAYSQDRRVNIQIEIQPTDSDNPKISAAR